MGNRKSYDVGIFGNAKENLGDFSSTFYLSLLLSQSCEQYDEVKEEYEKALASQDIKLITQKKWSLAFVRARCLLQPKCWRVITRLIRDEDLHLLFI